MKYTDIEKMAILCETEEQSEYREIAEEADTPSYPAPKEISANTVIQTDDKFFIRKYIEEIYHLMVDGYKDIGGMENLAGSPKGLLKKLDLAKIVFSDKGEVLACSTYKNHLGGNKIFLCSGKRNGGDGSKALEQIIITDIEPYNNWFWGEVSGAIEHYFQKHHGNPIPNYLAHKFLGKEQSEIICDPRGPEVDPIHYERMIGMPDYGGEMKRKSLWGYKDQSMADEVINAIQNDPNFKLNAETVTESIYGHYDEHMKSLELAIQTIAEIEEFREEKGCNELLPVWKEKLVDSVERVKTELEHSDDIDANRKRQLKSALSVAEDIEETMPVLTMRKFSL